MLRSQVPSLWPHCMWSALPWLPHGPRWMLQFQLSCQFPTQQERKETRTSLLRTPHRCYCHTSAYIPLVRTLGYTDTPSYKESFFQVEPVSSLSGVVGREEALVHLKERINVGEQLGMFATRMDLGFFIHSSQIPGNISPKCPCIAI